MNELLARLDGPPFPENEETILSVTIPIREGAPSEASQPVFPGTSAEEPTRSMEPVTACMFNMLCEQFAVLADTQTQDRERAERESKQNLELFTQSMARFSQQLATSRQPRDVTEHPVLMVPSTSALRPPSIHSTVRSEALPLGTVGPGDPSRVTLPVGPARPDHINPQALARSDDQVKTLRRHRPSANNATAILKELALLEADGKSRKGGANKNNNTQVEADWPDLYVYRIQGNKPTYDSLTMPEFVAGYLSIIEEATTVCQLNVATLKHISYLRQLMEDCFLADWHMVRAAHKHVLNGIEHKRFAWEDTAVVIDTKRSALARIQSCGFQASSNQAKPNANAICWSCTSSTCQPYQRLDCPFVNDHTVDNTIHMHCCSHCFAQMGFKRTHPQSNCRKAKEAAKGKAKRTKKKAAKE